MIAGTSRSATGLPPALCWVGPGRSAFAGAAGKYRQGEVVEAPGPEEVLSAFGGGGDAAFLRSLAAYFSAGGGPCLVLNLPPPDSLTAGQRSAWLGENGGPGYRTGLWALADQEEVGTIAVPGLLATDLRRGLLSGLVAREDLFVVLDELPGGEDEELPLAPRALRASGWVEGGEGPVPPSGPLLALLEASDFREDRPERALRALGGPGHPTLTGSPFASVESWRAWEGLRRSIDLGTRWVIFEQNGEFLWRRLEREVGAFLSRLHRLGLLEGRSADEAFRVRSLAGPRSRRGEGHLLLRIEVRVRGGGRRRVEVGAPLEAAAPESESVEKSPDQAREKEVSS